jgi:hypothetical protein
LMPGSYRSYIDIDNWRFKTSNWGRRSGCHLTILGTQFGFVDSCTDIHRCLGIDQLTWRSNLWWIGILVCPHQSDHVYTLYFCW